MKVIKVIKKWLKRCWEMFWQWFKKPLPNELVEALEKWRFRF